MNKAATSIDQPMPLIATVVLSAVAVLIFNALPVIMGVASEDLGLSAGQLGLLASLELGGIGLASVSGLIWIRRVAWRKVMVVAIIMLVAGNLLSAVVTDFTELIILRFFTGLLGEGVIFTIAMAAIGDAIKPDRAFAFSIVGQVGLGMVALLGFPYVAAAAGYFGVLGVMAILAFLCLFLVPWLPVGGDKDLADRHIDAITASRGNNTTPLIGLLAMFFWFVGLSGIWTFVERIGVQIPVAPTTIGTLLSIGLGLGALTSLLVALIGDRYGRLWPPLVATGIHFIMCFIFSGNLSLVSYSVLVLLFTFVWNLGLPYLLGLIADSDNDGRLVVLVVTAQAFGNTVGPLWAGQVVEFQGLSAVGLSSMLFCLLAIVTMTVFIYRVKDVLSKHILAANS